MNIASNKTKLMIWHKGRLVINHNCVIFSRNTIGTCGTGDRQYSTSRPLWKAREAYSSGYKWSSNISVDALPCALSHGVACASPWWMGKSKWTFELFPSLFSLLIPKLYVSPQVLIYFNYIIRLKLITYCIFISVLVILIYGLLLNLLIYSK